MEVPVRDPRHRLPTVLGALFTLLLPFGAASARGPGAQPSTADDKPIVLQSFHAGRFDLDLTMLGCRYHQCPIQVRLIEAGRVVDHVALPVPATSRHVRAETVDADWGADLGLEAWRSGFEADSVSTAGRLLTIAPGETALLVSQRKGLDHVTHAHLVVLPRHGRLRVIWRAPQNSGATWSATYVLAGTPGRGQDIAYLQGFLDPTDSNVADRIEALRLTWKPQSSSFHESPLPDRGMPLYVLRVAAYDSIAKARMDRSSYSFCLSPYWVLDGSAFPLKSTAHAFIGRVYTRRSRAAAAARQVKSCLPNLSPRVLRWAAPR